MTCDKTRHYPQSGSKMKTILVLWCLGLWSPSMSDANPQFGMTFPDGEAPDGTKYKTAYRCEGEDLRISCDPGETIQVVRANYGRFSIAICNKNGYTDWSVNCMSHTTTRILQRKCDGESFCDIEVNSGVFGDPCPNTHKYVEVHYACSSQQGNSGGTTTKKLPPWFLEGSAGSLWTSETLPQVPQKEVQKEISGSVSQIPQKPSPRKPILVAQDVIQTTPVPPSGTTPRIPITTPKNGESDTTTIRVDLTPSNREDTTTPSLASADSTTTLTTQVYLDNHCPPVFVRHLYWNWTRAGDVAIQPCPEGSTGLARWACDAHALSFRGGQPDMSDCKSSQVSDLETRVREEDPENVIVSTLERLTEKGSSNLYGGDLEAVVNILKAVLNRLQYLLQTKAGSFYNKESFLQEIYQNVLRTGSNLMANQSLPAWRDLSRSRRIKVASNLLQILQQHAFLLLGVIQEPELITESTPQIAVALSVIDTSSSNFLPENWTQFPSQPAHTSPYPKVTVNSHVKEDTLQHPTWGNNWTDVIGISNAVISQVPKAKLLFASFANLHHLLSDAEQKISTNNKGILDSHIVSADFYKQTQGEVKIVFEHLTGHSGQEHRCVHWDAQEDHWSDQGCQVLQSNASHTSCQCDHWGHFALWAQVEGDPEFVGQNLDFGLISQTKDQVSGQSNTVITLEIATYLVSSVCFLILVILLVQFRHPIKRGISRSPCCGHRLSKTRQRDDIVDKTHHQMYASTASMTQNNAIHVTLEQSLAPSGSTSGSTSSTGTASSHGDHPHPKLMTLNMATTQPHPHLQNTMPNWANNSHSLSHSSHPNTALLPPAHSKTISFKGKIKAKLGMRKRDPLVDNSTSEQGNLLSTLPRTTLSIPPATGYPSAASPKVLPPISHTPSMPVNPYSYHSVNCDSEESTYASVVYASPTNSRRYPKYSSTLKYHLSPNLSTRMSPVHKNVSTLSSTTTLSTCLSPRSMRYTTEEVPAYDPQLHHVYCEIPQVPHRVPTQKFRCGTKNETDLFEDTSHNISDLSDDENTWSTFGSPKHHHPHHKLAKMPRKVPLVPPPLRAAAVKTHEMSQLPATDV